MKKLVRRLGSIALSTILVVSMILPMNITNEVKAAAPYYVQVNKSTNVVTVFQDKVNGVYKNPIKAFVCSVGFATPSGTFRTQAKYRWHTLMGPSYGQYCTRIVGGFLFHSVWYYENGRPDTISVAQYNRLGTTASHGCIRLTVADAKWIYDNCPVGTEVKMMNGTSKNDPLGKPKAQKLNTNRRTDWCPTDPDPRNPYRKKKTEITGVSDITISVGDAFDPLKGIKAIEGTGSTLPVVVNGKVNKNKAGTYILTYKAEDSTGKTVSKKRKVVVKDNTDVVIYADSKTVQLGNKFSALKGVSAKTKAGADRTSTLKAIGKVNTNKVGVYTVTYAATNKNGKTIKKNVKITVKDMKKPILVGVKNHTILAADVVTGSSIDLRAGITAKASNGKNLTNRIKVSGTVNPKKVGVYKVIYTVENDSKIKTTKTAIYTVKDTEKTTIVEDNFVLKGVKNMTLRGAISDMTDEQRIDFIKEEVRKQVIGYDNGKEQPKDLIEIEVEEQDLYQYQVTVSFGTIEERCIVLLEDK